MWWPRQRDAGSSQGKCGARNKSVPQKTKGGSSKCDWSPLRPASAAFGTWTHGFDISLPALPPLPSPFPSPSHEATKDAGRHLSPQKRKANHHRRRPSSSAGKGKAAPAQSQHLRSAAILARGTDWISSKAAARPSTVGGAPSASWPWNEDRDHVPPRSPQKARSNSLPQLRKGEGHEEIEVLKLRHALNLPKEAMSQACDLFQRHADQPNMGSGLLKDRCLTKSGFTKVWCEMTHQDPATERDVPPQILSAFRHARIGQVWGLDFSQFAIWYSSNYFSEDVSLDKDGQKLRSIARKHSMHHADVERYQQIFNTFVRDGSGAIDASEFEKLLCKCTKVPDSIGLPAARVKHLWQIADEDGDHDINFEEFLTFYKRYLCTDSTGFEEFYRFGGHRAVSA